MLNDMLVAAAVVLNIPLTVLNWLALTLPFTCSQSAGEVVFIPMLPLLLRIVNRVVGVAPVCNDRLLGVVAVKLPFVDGTCARVAIETNMTQMNGNSHRFNSTDFDKEKKRRRFI